MSQIVGFVGAGNMGEPMIYRLLAAGHEVHAFARREEIRQRLAERGAVLAPSVAELATRSDVLISCLFSDQQLAQIAEGPDGLAARLKPGATLVSHTTGSLRTLKSIQVAAPALQILDAPVSGTAEHIAKGELTVLLGGPAEAVDLVTPLLGTYAKTIVATGELGSALNIKLINNLLFAANIQLLGAAAEIGARLGVEEGALLAALTECSGGSQAGAYVRAYGGAGVLAAGIGPVISKDVAACASAAEEAGIDLGLLAKVIEMGPFTWKPEAD